MKTRASPKYPASHCRPIQARRIEWRRPPPPPRPEIPPLGKCGPKNEDSQFELKFHSYLVLRLKPLSAGRISHRPAFIGDSPTISHTRQPLPPTWQMSSTSFTNENWQSTGIKIGFSRPIIGSANHCTLFSQLWFGLGLALRFELVQVPNFSLNQITSFS